MSLNGRRRKLGHNNDDYDDATDDDNYDTLGYPSGRLDARAKDTATGGHWFQLASFSLTADDEPAKFSLVAIPTNEILLQSAASTRTARVQKPVAVLRSDGKAASLHLLQASVSAVAGPRVAHSEVGRLVRVSEASQS